MPSRATTARGLLDLPDELLQHVLSFLLAPVDLARVALVCRRLHAHSYDDRIWQPLVQQHVWQTVTSAKPCSTFRGLYLAHHPYWFLTRTPIWFADNEPMGKVLMTRFNPERGSIEAHTMVGHMSDDSDLAFWQKNNEVVIHSFDPKISLDLSRPVLKLDINESRMQDPSGSSSTDNASIPSATFPQEVLMDIFTDPGLFSSLMLCRALPEIAIAEGTRVWPPLRFPSTTRTRNMTSSSYKSVGYHPNRLEEISESNFRLRKWAEYTGRRSNASSSAFNSANGFSAAQGLGGPYFAAGVGGGVSYRMPEDITTYATIPPSAFTPTPQKPWQGIWVGDYSGHGCEFLLIRQPDKRDEKPLPTGMNWLKPWFRGDRRGSDSSEASGSSELGHSETARLQAAREVLLTLLSAEDPTGQETLPIFSTVHTTNGHSETDYADVPTGRLEAIKLSGDPNIPRGEYTFIAPDIGHGGFLRVADEPEFQGARVVRSAGHVAARGFRRDQYTPSQLIMLSHNRLAQFWEAFGHISFYDRVDLNALMEQKGT